MQKICMMKECYLRNLVFFDILLGLISTSINILREVLL